MGLWDEAGVGKTYQVSALFAQIMAARPGSLLLVVSDIARHADWRSTLASVHPEFSHRVLHYAGGTRHARLAEFCAIVKATGRSGLILTNRHAVNKDFFTPKDIAEERKGLFAEGRRYQALAVDDAYRAVSKLASTGGDMALALNAVVNRVVGIVVAASATPLCHRVADMESFCQFVRVREPPLIRSKYDLAAPAVTTLLAKITMRKLHSEVWPSLPVAAQVPTIESVSAGQSQALFLAALVHIGRRDLLVLDSARGTQRTAFVQHIPAFLTRMRQLTSGIDVLPANTQAQLSQLCATLHWDIPREVEETMTLRQRIASRSPKNARVCEMLELAQNSSVHGDEGLAIYSNFTDELDNLETDMRTWGGILPSDGLARISRLTDNQSPSVRTGELARIVESTKAHVLASRSTLGSVPHATGSGLEASTRSLSTQDGKDSLVGVKQWRCHIVLCTYTAVNMSKINLAAYGVTKVYQLAPPWPPSTDETLSPQRRHTSSIPSTSPTLRGENRSATPSWVLRLADAPAGIESTDHAPFFSTDMWCENKTRSIVPHSAQHSAIGTAPSQLPTSRSNASENDTALIEDLRLLLYAPPKKPNAPGDQHDLVTPRRTKT
jgi:hypothetical protein